MFDLSQHLAKARYLPDLTPDVGYSIRPTLFYGKYSKARPNDMRDQSVAFYTPPYVQKWLAMTLDVERREKDMLRYYTEVLRAAKQHRQDLLHLSSYFGLQPVLRSKGKTLIAFSWPESYLGAAGFLRAVPVSGPDGSLYGDMDQGWQFEMYAEGNKLYMADGSDEDTRPSVVYCTNRDHFAGLAATALARLQQQVALFVRETGQNPWRYA